MLNIKMSTKGGPVFTFSLLGRVARPLAPHQLCLPLVVLWCLYRQCYRRKANTIKLYEKMFTS